VISIELLLANIDSTSSEIQSVGTLTVRSRAMGRTLNQIIARINPLKERARAGAQVAIQHFELDP